MFQTEYEFMLPKGYVDEEGNLHRKGVMRMATAADEIIPLRDPMVQQNPSYLTIAILARVIIKLGTLDSVNKHIIENMFTADMSYLQDLYDRINSEELPEYQSICPNCGEKINIPVNFMNTGE